MKSFIKSLTGLLFILMMSGVTSCVKKEYDEPPTDGTNPNITVTHTIAQIKAMYAGTPLRIDSDYVISGVVIADDKSGNFYKSVVIQDSTAGIAIRLDQSDFYTDFPAGRLLFIKCKGLYIGDYGGLIQMGGYVDNSGSTPSVEPIPNSLISSIILKGTYNMPVTPKVVTINQLTSNLQNTLIQLNDVQFANSDLGKTYADAVNQMSANRTVEDCNGNTTILRSSGFALFASQVLPAKKGKLVAVYQEFNGDAQLLIRDVTDVMFDSARCGSTPPTGAMDLNDFRAAFATSSTCPSVTVKGIVISDRANGNIDSKNLVIQDSTGGITVRFTAAHSFNKGDEVEVVAAGLSFNEFNGLLQINNAPLTNATFKSSGNNVTPRIATFAQINTNAEAWESTLIQINTVSFPSSGGNYSGTVTLTDASGTMPLYTRTGATFANTAYPNTGTHSVTAVLYPFNGPQLTIRSTTDVQ
ncbi:MAG: hypothetical protein JNK61_11070 [Bacteroidia bacterium]|nr:hypothetical protein [Bacteroidia bacterium]